MTIDLLPQPPADDRRFAELAAMVEPVADGCSRYTGPLNEARAEVLLHRFVAEHSRSHVPGEQPLYEVLLCEAEPADWDSAVEWGISHDCHPETAWRYALAAFFDPAEDR